MGMWKILLLWCLDQPTVIEESNKKVLSQVHGYRGIANLQRHAGLLDAPNCKVVEADVYPALRGFAFLQLGTVWFCLSRGVDLPRGRHLCDNQISKHQSRVVLSLSVWVLIGICGMEEGHTLSACRKHLDHFPCALISIPRPFHSCQYCSCSCA